MYEALPLPYGGKEVVSDRTLAEVNHNKQVVCKVKTMKKRTIATTDNIYTIQN